MMIPGATEEQMRWLDELQRVAVSATTAVARRCCQRRTADCIDLLPGARRADAGPALAARPDERLRGTARLLATRIAGARLVTLDSDNHVVLGDEPAWQVVVEEVRRVPRARRCAGAGRRTCCRRASARWSRWSALGRRNEEIADELVLSVRTVERHLQNAYTKLGVHGPSARAAAAAALART